MIQEGQTYIVNGIHELGKFMLHYGSTRDNPSKECLTACFKCKKDLSGVSLISGFKDYNQHFYPCPVSSFFVQLNSLRFITDNSSESVVADVIIFSKDYLKYKPLEIRYPTKSQNDIMGINFYINLLNHYIEYDNNVDDINEQLFLERLNIYPIHQSSLAEIINKLTIKFYENSFSRVGKDNQFWNEAIITDLPENTYLTYIIKETLNNTELYKYEKANIRLENDTLILQYNHTNGYSPHHGRQPLPDDYIEADRIKDLIKMNIYNFFDTRQEINQRLKHD